MLKKIIDKIQQKPVYGWLLFGGITAGVFVLGLLAASITERRAEVASVFNNRKVEISGIESRNEIWGQNYPREYQTWREPPKQIIGASIWAICRKMFLKHGLRWSFSGRAMLSRATILPLAATLML